MELKCVHSSRQFPINITTEEGLICLFVQANTFFVNVMFEVYESIGARKEQHFKNGFLKYLPETICCSFIMYLRRSFQGRHQRGTSMCLSPLPSQEHSPIPPNPGGGGSKYKGLSGDVPLKWVSKSASWYNDDPLFSAKLV